MMKKCLCLAVIFFAFLSAAEAEPKFNALDRDDPLYAQYERNLCAGTYEAYQRFYSDRYWMDHLDPKMAGMSPDRREAWVTDYVVTTALRDSWLERFNANCR